MAIKLPCEEAILKSKERVSFGRSLFMINTAAWLGGTVRSILDGDLEGAVIFGAGTLMSAEITSQLHKEVKAYDNKLEYLKNCEIYREVKNFEMPPVM